MHIIDTISGFSGSPAFVYDEVNDDIVFIGIVTNGNVEAGRIYVLKSKVIEHIINSL